jgi:hypothetical protein
MRPKDILQVGPLQGGRITLYREKIFLDVRSNEHTCSVEGVAQRGRSHANEPNNSHTLGEHQQLFRSRERVCTHVVDGRIRDFRAIPVDFARIPCFLSGLHSPPVGGRNAHSYRADTEVSAQLRWNLSGTFTIFRFHHPKF